MRIKIIKNIIWLLFLVSPHLSEAGEQINDSTQRSILKNNKFKKYNYVIHSTGKIFAFSIGGLVKIKQSNWFLGGETGFLLPIQYGVYPNRLNSFGEVFHISTIANWIPNDYIQLEPKISFSLAWVSYDNSEGSCCIFKTDLGTGIYFGWRYFKVGPSVFTSVSKEGFFSIYYIPVNLRIQIPFNL